MVSQTASSGDEAAPDQVAESEAHLNRAAVMYVRGRRQIRMLRAVDDEDTVDLTAKERRDALNRHSLGSATCSSTGWTDGVVSPPASSQLSTAVPVQGS